ncbi:hypothetical protein [Qipengyuania sp. DGS5-3]|uniref:hypothetical protein n=1 Tax=Qipengyuania sp. DGS5-3 TaxID=3349632 RepID=UPI0036D2F6B8
MSIDGNVRWFSKGARALISALISLGSPVAAKSDGGLNSANSLCELHIWAARDFSSLPFGSGLAPGLAIMFPGDIDGDIDDQFAEIVSGKLQFEAIRRANPISSLGLPPGTRLVTHVETEEDKVTKKRKERRSDSTSDCYFELHIRYHYLIEDIVWGDRFATTFDFRHYSANSEWVLRHRGEGGNKLTVFPVKEEDDPAQVLQEISEAIEANFVEYAPKAKRKLARKRR